PVENRGLNFALLEGYHTALMKGRYPVCCLFLEIDPAAVDVNIHPAKREVKFHRESEVRRLVAQAVRETLLVFHSGTKAAEEKGTQGTKETQGTQATRAMTRVPASEATEAKTVTGPATPQLPKFPLPPLPVPEEPSHRAEQPPFKMG